MPQSLPHTPSRLRPGTQPAAAPAASCLRVSAGAAAQTMSGNVSRVTTVRVMLRIVKPSVVSLLMSRHVLGVNKGSVAGRRTTPAQLNPASSQASKQS